jgi:DNA-binding PadR family transcriptional regulator
MAEPPLTPAVFHVLLALADGPLHGYAVMQAVERTAGTSLSTGPGTIYGTIQRLEEAGLVRELLGARSGRRRQYALTSQGRRALEHEARRLTDLVKLVRARRIAPHEA